VVFRVWPDGFEGRQFDASNALKNDGFSGLSQLWKTGWKVCVAMHKWARRIATNPGGKRPSCPGSFLASFS
jgi:hypothetical protein